MVSNQARSLSEAQELAAPLPALLIEAERVASGVIQGVHGRRRKGIGESFWEYRRYTHEDPAFRIDWRQSAKSDHLYVRENEWEAAQSCWFWVDNSASMMYRSGFSAVTKHERSLVLALACATLLVQAGERVASAADFAPPTQGARGVEILARHLMRPAERGLKSLSGTRLPDFAHIPPYCDIVLISDFLMDPDHVAQRFDVYADQRLRVHSLQVLDPAEEDFPFQGRTRFEGVEESLSYVAGDAAALRAPYRQVMAAQRDALKDAGRRHGWLFGSHRTDHGAQLALLSLYMSLSGTAGLPRAAGLSPNFSPNNSLTASRPS